MIATIINATATAMSFIKMQLYAQKARKLPRRITIKLIGAFAFIHSIVCSIIKMHSNAKSGVKKYVIIAKIIMYKIVCSLFMIEVFHVISLYKNNIAIKKFNK